MKTKASIIFLLITVALIFSSCGERSYKTSSLNCKELSAELEKEFLLPESAFQEYSNEDIQFLFSSTELYDDSSLSYSVDSTDICEIGVFHSPNEEDAKKLFEDANIYIKNMQEQKSEFLRNYSPQELNKLNSAEARRYGRYVIFAVANKDCKTKIFEKAEELLS